MIIQLSGSYKKRLAPAAALSPQSSLGHPRVHATAPGGSEHQGRPELEGNGDGGAKEAPERGRGAKEAPSIHPRMDLDSCLV